MHISCLLDIITLNTVMVGMKECNILNQKVVEPEGISSHLQHSIPIKRQQAKYKIDEIVKFLILYSRKILNFL